MSDLRALAEVLELRQRATAPVDVEAQRAAELATHRERVRLALPDHLRRCGVGEKHAQEILAGLRATAAVTYVRTWWAAGKTFLLLTGHVGSGKTVAACDLFTKLTKRGGYEFIGPVDEWDTRAGRVVQAGELARLGLFREDRDELERWVSRRFLVLDDLGSEYLTDPWRANLFHLVNSRWLAQRRTVITTNLDIEGLKAKYEARIFDRIRDSGRAVHCGDKSLRGAP